MTDFSVLVSLTKPDDVVSLDSLRAEVMRYLLDDRGQREVWKYDIVTAKHAFHVACLDYNFDNIEAHRDGKPFVLIGPGICDHYFRTPEDLVQILEWLCRDGGYLSCYAAGRRQQQKETGS